MQKHIVTIDKKKGVYQITTTSERWYTITSKNKETGLPEYQFIPSVTWITGYVYKGIGFYKWLAKTGWNEAEAIKEEAGDKGTKVHNAIEQLILGAEVKMEDKYYSKLTEKDEELNPDEYGAILSFQDWFNTTKPEPIMQESTVISKKHNFAGTVDFVGKIDGDIWIVDWKTSQYVWPSMEAQLSAYKRGLQEQGRNVDKVRLAVLQVGYKRNKRGWKFTEVEDQFDEMFLPAQKFWDKDNKNKEPKQVEMPLSLKLDLTKTEEPEVSAPKKVQTTSKAKAIAKKAK